MKFSVVGIVLMFISQAALAVDIQVESIEGKPLKDMVVYLVPVSAPSAAGQVTAKPIEIHQKDKKFAPYITVVQKGYEAQFKNEDDITHHIYSALGPKRFSFKLRSDDGAKSILFDKAGHVSMGCNIHDWMSGHVLVIDTPFYTQTNAQGIAHINDVPAGQYQLNVWHPQLQSEENRFIMPVMLPSSNRVEVKLTAKMAAIPEQKSLDDFEFLEGY